MSHQESILSLWEELKVLVDVTALDVAKGMRGNGAAAARARRQIRDLRKAATVVLKEMITLSQDEAAAKLKARVAKSPELNK